MLLVKTGLDPEYDAVIGMLNERGRKPNVQVVRGVWKEADLQRLRDVEAIISIGTCGGLCPGPNPPMPQVGQVYIASDLITPVGHFSPDMTWTANLHSSILNAQPAIWWSSGKFNTADDVKSREAIWQQSNATIIDDESYEVAKFAAARAIPFAIMRVVSDTCTASDNLPPAARNAITSDGGFDVFAVIKSILKDSHQLLALEHCWKDFNLAIASLRLALDQIGPDFCFLCKDD